MNLVQALALGIPTMILAMLFATISTKLARSGRSFWALAFKAIFFVLASGFWFGLFGYAMTVVPNGAFWEMLFALGTYAVAYLVTITVVFAFLHIVAPSFTTNWILDFDM